MNDYAIQLLVARNRVHRVIERFGATPEAATLWGIEEAIDDVDGTGRPATDAELAVVARALIGDLR
ncbi:MAG: hypothetical protein IPG94_22690 [Kineosporiaceae bacterium]|nr:hypothetical protein [Kineosporiaceae bacterium]